MAIAPAQLSYSPRKNVQRTGPASCMVHESSSEGALGMASILPSEVQGELLEPKRKVCHSASTSRKDPAESHRRGRVPLPHHGDP